MIPWLGTLCGLEPAPTHSGEFAVFGSILTKIFGTNNERVVKRLMPIVHQINAIEPQIVPLSDDQLRAKTVDFRARIAARLEGITDEDTNQGRREGRTRRDPARSLRRRP